MGILILKATKIVSPERLRSPEAPFSNSEDAAPDPAGEEFEDSVNNPSTQPSSPESSRAQRQGKR